MVVRVKTPPVSATESGIVPLAAGSWLRYTRVPLHWIIIPESSACRSNGSPFVVAKVVPNERTTSIDDSNHSHAVGESVKNLLERALLFCIVLHVQGHPRWNRASVQVR